MDERLVVKAAEALQSYHGSQQRKGKPKLIEDNPVVSLIVALRKIPDRRFRPHQIRIPHSLHPPVESEVCLFTKDDKTTTKKLLEEKGIKFITKIIPLDKLRTNFKTFEAKRQLSSSFDVYLADKRIYRHLKPTLGKNFFRKKRFPIPVDIHKKDLSAEFQRAKDSTYMHLGLGSCCAIPVAHIGFPLSHITENIVSGVRGVVQCVPRGWRNIQSLHIKTTDSIALPIYNSLPLPASLLSDDKKESSQPQTVVLEDVSSDEEVVDLPPPSPPRKVKRRKTTTPKIAPKKIKGSSVISSKFGRTPRKQRTV